MRDSLIARVLATSHPETVSAVILAPAEGRMSRLDVSSARFRAGDPILPEQERRAL